MEATVDTTQRLLEKRTARSLPIPAGCAMTAGLTLSAVPAIMGGLLIYARVTHLSTAPPWYYLLPVVVGLAFGLSFVLYGARTLRRQRLGREGAALHPNEPWYADWSWDPTGVGPSAGPLGLQFLVGGGICAACAFFTYAFFFEVLPTQGAGEDATSLLVIKVAVGLFVLVLDLIGLRLAYSGLSNLVRGLRQPSRLAFETFPFFRGRPLRARVTSERLARCERVVATLRCLEERPLHRGGIRRQDSMAVFQVYEARLSFEGRSVGDSKLDVAFQLPEGDLATRLGQQPPRYWELDVETGNDDPITFLVPVY